ncbi:CGNR zinc finger domain-containing protein [Lentzea sp. BCCO 10_0856]|uniref:CGNR zinc finger domain-containing protein n=1 Tax=Lentzea miocenica TaxID=3095431 RepID=A0ABU4T652_9PSEU|nr:CGNR zinc finger domain-containing protein [Lentzea sp. BCCO 10_0856]MDX8033447.1 CGNR zinc finger domain-containing protein [Lentzea sp. BCCO 10_0856]
MVALPDGSEGETALALVSTIAHDGHGGVADFFADDAGVNAWVAARFPDLTPRSPAQAERLRTLRFAARSAFAASVSPHPPSRVERSRRMSDEEAAAVLRAAINALEPRTTVVIGDQGVQRGLDTSAQDQTFVEGALALAVVEFLTGPLAPRLRSCQAPRCVRYFVQQHGRQQWCKASCGNRARVARFADRQISR